MAATEIVSGVSGESEEKLRDLFLKAKVRFSAVTNYIVHAYNVFYS